ncbi:outer membrane protein [uncultured Devosia sp.]|uniref:outer membrane protein n=1 Tax=uncultured Devosia sp. TaxID=211434 RepID=UPI0035CAD14F
MFVRSLSLGVAAAALLSSGAMAADLFIPTTPEPIYEAAGFSWDGLYAGVQAGGLFSDVDVVDGAGLVTDEDITFGAIGAHVGVNFTVADPIILGAELQGNYLFNSDADISAGEFLALGRVGAVVTDQVLVYAAGGFGMQFSDDIIYSDGDDSTGIYALGGGVEFAVTDAVSIRGEVLGIGYLDDGDDEDDFFDAARATVGVSYHF